MAEEKTQAPPVAAAPVLTDEETKAAIAAFVEQRAATVKAAEEAAAQQKADEEAAAKEAAILKARHDNPGEHAGLEQPTGAVTYIEFPARRERTILVEGVTYEHCDTDADGVWIYRKA